MRHAAPAGHLADLIASARHAGILPPGLTDEAYLAQLVMANLVQVRGLLHGVDGLWTPNIKDMDGEEEKPTAGDFRSRNFTEERLREKDFDNSKCMPAPEFDPHLTGEEVLRQAWSRFESHRKKTSTK